MLVTLGKIYLFTKKKTIKLPKKWLSIKTNFENYKDTAIIISHLFPVFSLVTFLQMGQLVEALRQLSIPELQ